MGDQMTGDQMTGDQMTGDRRVRTRAVAVVPLRDVRSGKTRLATSLTAADRGALVVALARHVVSTLLASPGVVEVLVVTEEPVSARDALDGVAGPVRVVAQPPGGPGLNAAVDAGRTRVLDERAAGRLLVVHADLPALAPGDVAALLEAAHTTRPGPSRAAAARRPSAPDGGRGAGAGITLATDRAGTGTNAVVLDRADRGFVFRFGPGSLQAHRAEAARRGLVPAVVRRAGTACDLDTEADWRALPEPVRRRVVGQVPAMAALTAAG